MLYLFSNWFLLFSNLYGRNHCFDPNLAVGWNSLRKTCSIMGTVTRDRLKGMYTYAINPLELEKNYKILYTNFIYFIHFIKFS